MPKITIYLFRSRIYGQTANKTTAHAVHYGAWYINDKQRREAIIFKENKHSGEKGQQASKYEAVFSELALLFVRPGLTPSQDLVYHEIVNDNNPLRKEIDGVASLNMQDILKKMVHSKNLNGKLYRFSKDDYQGQNLKQGLKPSFENLDSINMMDEKFKETLKILCQLYIKVQKEFKSKNANLFKYGCDHDENFLVKILSDPKTAKIVAGQLLQNDFKIKEEHGEIFKKIHSIYVEISKGEATKNNDKKEISESLTDLQLANLVQDEIESHGLKSYPELGMNNSFQFLDKMPHGFFSDLMKLHNDGHVVIDMDSLACVLTTSYALEEDDLHKGNIGFYVTDGDEGRKKFTFFKIDHDLMMSSSIMSHIDARQANMFYNKDSFKITAKDLMNFPNLTDSGNHYWPTVKNFLVKGDKAYTHTGDRNAFISLKDNSDFKNAKWKYFLKFILMPDKLIDQSLIKHLDMKNLMDQHEITKIGHDVKLRMANLRHVLLTIPEFKSYLRQLENNQNNQDDLKVIKTEISQYCNYNNFDAGIDEKFQSLIEIVNKKITDPVSIAIELGEYSGGITPVVKKPRFFSNINEDDTSMKHAFDKFTTSNNKLKNKNEIKNNVLESRKSRFFHSVIMSDLNERGVHTAQYQKFIEHKGEKKSDLAIYLTSKDRIEDMESLFIDSQFDEFNNFSQQSPNKIKPFNKFKEIENVHQLGLVFSNLCKETTMSLKTQKRLACEILKITKLDEFNLKLLKNALSAKNPGAPFAFINELRTSLWIIRKIRGSYGFGETNKEMMKIIKEKLGQCSEKKNVLQK